MAVCMALTGWAQTTIRVEVKFMFNGFIEDNEDWDPSITDAGSFVSYPGPAEGNGAWVFVVCGHI